ncbi:MAG: hypothetical protein HQK62_00170 [Desulfamplus sp.]|nr:hypothetical protein [Desulfamplus sp.]MBF0257246.1 hypothetical protein [Desulfamplus sp.]
MNDSLPKSASPKNEQKNPKHEASSPGDKENSPAIIFGLKDYPRPRNSGFFYCKPPSMFGNFSIKTLAVLDLYNTDRQYITQIITKGIECMLEDDEYADNKEHYLTNYETENMKPFVQNILKQVIENKLLLTL